MAIHTILVTGANGQLGWELGQLAANYPAFKFVFIDRSQLDLSYPESFEKIIQTIAPDCIINTAAYTAVDKSETEKELAFCWGVKRLVYMPPTAGMACLGKPPPTMRIAAAPF